MPVYWRSEALDRPLDPQTGVFSVRLTAAAMHSVNIYCEQPYTSPDGRRIAIMRSAEADPRIPPYELLVADVYTYKNTSVEKDARSQFVGTAAYSGWIYYVSASRDLMRFSVATLDKEVLWPRWPFDPDFTLQSVSADMRYLIGVQYRADFTSEIVRIDLRERTWKIIATNTDCLTHLQFEPVNNGRNDILVQLNTGQAINHMWEQRKTDSPNPGGTHFIIDVDGGNYRSLPIGPPLTTSIAGHAAWVADTGQVVLATHFNGETWGLDSRWPTGNLFLVAPGQKKPRVYDAPEHRFNHVSVSRDGRYWVCDSYPTRLPAPIQIVVGSVKTGKHRVLISDCGASGGGPACGHPHAYLTADNRHVIFNADPHWIGQVFAARVPEGFLAALD